MLDQLTREHRAVLSLLLCPVLVVLILSHEAIAQQQEPGKQKAGKKRQSAKKVVDVDNLSFANSTAKVYKTVDDVRLKAHMFYPEEYNHGAKGKSLPAIVFFFGGGWNTGSPAQFEQHCRYLAARGMIAITADYRVASRQGVKAKSCVADAKSAVRWMRTNAKDLGIDPTRIVVGGGSAGGHIAACTGVISGLEDDGEDLSVSSRPDAMALFNPALVLAPVSGFEANAAKLESFKSRTGVALEKISPLHQLEPGAPPAIIFHGTKDTTVPFQTAQLFAQAMKNNGDRCELDAYDSQGHGFFNFRKGKSKENFRATVESLDRFLVSLGYLEESKSDSAKQILQ
ncbi:MAG: alpha/beta hydrolase [Planctomycetota bacterium]